MADSGDIDSALVAKLVNDSALMAIATDGVYFDVAKAGATKFIIVSLLSALDTPMMQGTAYEDPIYLVKAVALSTTGADVKSAAARIHTLLHHQPLTVDGYSLMTMRRVERIRYTEVDENNDARWQHSGGQYEVMVSST